MHIITKQKSTRHNGMTLLELTVVIFVLLSLISILFVGARGWKRGSDRATCVMNIRQAQLCLRSHQNVNGLSQGTTINMFTDILGPDSYLSVPTCPAGGNYNYIAYIPAQGELAMWCSLAATQEHEPALFGDW
ncbi:type II secretion system protein [Luteolibacter sp. AS25]|uniref:type II secretion system protein n=1 Tax=Luteolibacter sp. AS25 TaxID=3135776 RepID=UPI00398B387D